MYTVTITTTRPSIDVPFPSESQDPVMKTVFDKYLAIFNSCVDVETFNVSTSEDSLIQTRVETFKSKAGYDKFLADNKGDLTEISIIRDTLYKSLGIKRKITKVES